MDAKRIVPVLEVLGDQVVEPGDPAKSYLIHKLDGSYKAVGGTGDPMPKMDIPHPLAASDIALITQWIAEGAPNN